MAKSIKPIPPPPPETPPRSSDRELMGLVHEIADLLADRDPWQIERVLATLDTFFPRKMRIEASRSVEGMT